MPGGIDSVAAPHMERALIGSILQEPERYYEVADKIVTDDFSTLVHRAVWNAIEQLVEAQRIPDMQTVTTVMMEKHDELGMDRQDLIRQVADMYQNASEPANISAYAATVTERAMRLRLVYQGRKQEQLARDLKTPLNDIISTITGDVMKATEQAPQTLVSMDASADAYIDTLEDRRANGDAQHIDTGIRGLDENRMGGLRGTVTHVLGLLGNGKSQLTMSVLLNNARHIKAHGKNECAVLATLEMTEQEVTEVLISMISGVWRKRLQEPASLTDDEMVLVYEARAELRELPIYIFDMDELQDKTVSELKRKLYMYVLPNYDRVYRLFVDGLWLMERDGGNLPSDGETGAYPAINKAMIRLAKQFDCPVWFVHQFATEVASFGETMKPHEDHARGRGRALVDSQNCIGLIRRPSLDERSAAQIYHMKCRYSSRTLKPIEIYYNLKHNRYETGRIEDTHAIEF